MMPRIPARIARRNGTNSRARSVSRAARTTGSSSWESAEVAPCPGKCFPTDRTPPWPRPAANAIARRAASSASPEKARSPITGLRGLESTSSTGAKSMSIPTERSSAPTAAPNSLAIPAFRPRKREHERAGGKSEKCGPRKRATRPPSWSTAISGRGAPRRAAPRISRHRARTWAGDSTFRENSTIPPTSPRASHRAAFAGSDVPSNPTHNGEATVSLPRIMLRESITTPAEPGSRGVRRAGPHRRRRGTAGHRGAVTAPSPVHRGRRAGRPPRS